MRRLVHLLLLVTLAACSDRPPRVTEMQVEADVVQPGVVCRVGKDGGPLLADRGIGGTGVSFGDRLTDRGIGGTGIVGVVTGFASICVGGLEVRYDGNVPVDIDGNVAAPNQLRVGQVVAIRAAVPAAGTSLPSWARFISIRTEVAGPIEAVDVDRNAMTVAGQRVVMQPSTWGASHFGLGDWVAVGGLRRSDGTIMASRLDETPTGKLFVRGQVSRRDNGLWIGTLRLAGPGVGALRASDRVAVSGSYVSGVGQVTSVAPDMLASSPTTYFGGAVNQLVLQALVTVDRDVVWLNESHKVPLVPALHQPKPISGDAIVTLERQPDGSFLAVGLRYTKYPSTSGEIATVSQAWHVTTVLPIPPMPPPMAPLPGGSAAPADVAADPVPDAVATPKATSSEEPGSATRSAAPPGSCADCTGTQPDERPMAQKLRPGVDVAAAAKRPIGRITPASVTVFSSSDTAPPRGPENIPSRLR
ncbi:MAG: DUF5666 domain-containing protein [Acetobacteraceae bacterium]